MIVTACDPESRRSAWVLKRTALQKQDETARDH